MKITVLAENTVCDTTLEAEHGLSLFIETKNHSILFDSGQTDLFYNNAKKLGVDVSKADICILSHGHYDHGGGLLKFLEINENASIYMNENCFGEYLNGTEKYIGLSKELQGNNRVITVGDKYKIDDELSLFSCNNQEKPFGFDSFGLNAVCNGKIIPDQFLHEHYLVITEDSEKVVISGCSHKGVLNIQHWLKPDYFVGGFHLSKLEPENTEDEKRLTEIAEKLMSYSKKYYTCHCTGTKQYDFLKKIMCNRLDYIYTGKIFEI